MQMTPLRKPMVRVALFTAVATGAVVVACSPRIASDLTGPGTKPVSAVAAKAEAEKMTPGNVYFESQVEQPVTTAPGSTGPTYPGELKAQRIEGTVLAMFVVDEQGRPEIATLKIARATDPAFEASVREALPNMRFVAAEIGGRKVKQLVQQPFAFALGNSKQATKQPLSFEAGKGDVNARPAPATTPASHQEGQPYFESQVEVPVSIRSGSFAPVYPEQLKAQRIQGTVLSMFVVNEDGRVNMRSFKVLKSDDPAFEAAVKEALATVRFTAATIGGVAVKQLVQQPFSFALSK